MPRASVIKFTIMAIDKFSAVGRQIAATTKQMAAGVKNAAASFRQFAARVSRSGESVRRFGKSISRLGRDMQVLSAASAAASFFSLKAATGQEDAEFAVAEAIKHRGKMVGFTTKQLYEQAKALSAVSQFSDEDILANVTAPLLQFKKIRGSMFQEAQKLAVDLASAKGIGLDDASGKIGGALGAGDMADLLPGLDEKSKHHIRVMFETNQVLAAQGLLVSKLKEAYGGEAKARLETFGASMKQLKVEVTDGAEELGVSMIPTIRQLIPLVKDGVKWFRGLSAETKEWIAKTLLIVSVLGSLLIIVGKVITVLGYLGPVFTLIWTIMSKIWLVGTLIVEFFAGLGLVATATIGILLAGFLAWSYIIYNIRDYWRDLNLIMHFFWEDAKAGVASFGRMLKELVMGPLSSLGAFFGFSVDGSVSQNSQHSLDINIKAPKGTVGQTSYKEWADKGFNVGLAVQEY